jgi:defect in organelle trafficking protein DotD
MVAIIMNIFKGFLMFAAALTLVACSDKKAETIHYTYIAKQSPLNTKTDINAQAAIAQTANTSVSSLSQLSAIQSANNPQVKLNQPLDAEAVGMAQQASLDWDGPVEQVLQKIAKGTRYKLKVLGVKPSTPVLVTIHAKRETVAQILRDVSYQTLDAQRGTIKVYPAQRVIELRYNNH